jgi:signal transduction histidine kinase
MRESIDALKENSAARLPADLPSEFQPLVSSIAELLDAREQDLATVRRRSMDLARGLRSPLAAMSAGSRRAREAGAANAAEGLDRAIATATAAVSRELEHSRVTPNRHATRHFHTAARFAVERAISAVEPQGSSAEQLFEVDVPDDLFLPVAPENLAELLGAILDNAVRFAKARVKISGAVTENAAVLVIEDDGPGLGPYHAAQVTSRRGSLDEAAASEKLSVAREWVEATRGQLTLGDAAIGGLKVQIDWPAAKR